MLIVESEGCAAEMKIWTGLDLQKPTTTSGKTQLNQAIANNMEGTLQEGSTEGGIVHWAIGLEAF